MRIGGHEIDHPLVLSPMVDVTDAPFRAIAKQWGADVTCSEMVSATGLVHENATSWRLVERHPSEDPYGVQIMGPEADVIAQAIELVGQRIQPDFLDLNLGCPSPNILRSCSGAFLLRDPEKAGRILRAAKDACDDAGIPQCSVKMRLGHNHESMTFLEVGKAAQDAGCDWATLHGRTVVQGYSGEADWSKIKDLVEHLDIPVIGNGDLKHAEDPARMRDETGCAGFFVARAAMHDPTVFRRMRDHLEGREAEPAPDFATRMGLFLQYIEGVKARGEPHVGELRRQGTRFVSGVRGARELRGTLHKLPTVEAIEDYVRQAIEAGT